MRHGNRYRSVGAGVFALALAATLAACSSSGAKDELVAALPGAIDAVTSGADNRSDYFQSINDGTNDTTVCFVTQHSGGDASLTMDFDASITSAGDTCSGSTPAAGIYLVGTTVYSMDASSANLAYNEATTTPELAKTLASDLSAQQIDPTPLKAMVDKADEVTSSTDNGMTSYTLKASYADVTTMLSGASDGSDTATADPTASPSAADEASIAQVDGDLTIVIDSQGRISSFSYNASQSTSDLGGAPAQSWKLNIWYDYDAGAITAPANAVPTDPPTVITTREDLEAFAGV